MAQQDTGSVVTAYGYSNQQANAAGEMSGGGGVSVVADHKSASWLPDIDPKERGTTLLLPSGQKATLPYDERMLLVSGDEVRLINPDTHTAYLVTNPELAAKVQKTLYNIAASHSQEPGENGLAAAQLTAQDYKQAAALMDDIEKGKYKGTVVDAPLPAASASKPVAYLEDDFAPQKANPLGLSAEQQRQIESISNSLQQQGNFSSAPADEASHGTGQATGNARVSGR